MPTIREVAALANVSVATVSRVLNNDQTYKMKEETRQRVWQAVAQTGYRLPSTAKPPAEAPLERRMSVWAACSASPRTNTGTLIL